MFVRYICPPQWSHLFCHSSFLPPPTPSILYLQSSNFFFEPHCTFIEVFLDGWFGQYFTWGYEELFLQCLHLPFAQVTSKIFSWVPRIPLWPLLFFQWKDPLVRCEPAQLAVFIWVLLFKTHSFYLRINVQGFIWVIEKTLRPRVLRGSVSESSPSRGPTLITSSSARWLCRMNWKVLVCIIFPSNPCFLKYRCFSNNIVHFSGQTYP